MYDIFEQQICMQVATKAAEKLLKVDNYWPWWLR